MLTKRTPYFAVVLFYLENALEKVDCLIGKEDVMSDRGANKGKGFVDWCIRGQTTRKNTFG